MTESQKKEKKKRAEKQDTYTNIAVEGATTETVQRYGSAIKEHLVAYSGTDNETGEQLKRGLKQISQSKVNPEYADNNLRQQAGFAAENKYTARENAERIIRKDGTRVHNTDIKGSGDYNELIDHIIKDKNGNVIAQEQMKFVGNSPKAALDKLASAKYQKYFDADATITVPKDYYEGIKDEAEKSITSFKKQLERAKTNGNTKLASELEAKIAKYEKIKASIKDSGITNAEAMEARLHPARSTAKDIGKLSARAGGEAAALSAMTGGCISIIQNCVALIKGEKSADEAALSVAGDTATAGALGFATGFTSSGIKAALQNSSKEALRSLSKTNFAASIVTTTVETGKTLKKYMCGDISGLECLEELGEKGTGQLSAAMFAVAGQMLIPIPVVGGIIGSMVGYALSSACYKELTDALKQQKLAHEERIRVEKECREAIALIQQYRAEMEAVVSQYLSDHIAVFNDAFCQMNRAIGLDDINGFMAGTNTITAKLGGEVKFSNYSAFDSFMKTDKTLKL